jgi:hypothetical protein
MAEAEQHPPEVTRIAAGCPWCPPGTRLVMSSDGLGTVALSCTVCGTRGPSAEITGSFADADAKAVAKWCDRPPSPPPLDPVLLDRLNAAIGLSLLLGGASSVNSASVSVALADLQELMRAASGSLK